MKSFHEKKIKYLAEDVHGCSWVSRRGHRVYAEIVRHNPTTIRCKIVSSHPEDAYHYSTGREYRVPYELCRPETKIPLSAKPAYPVGLTITAVRWSTSEDLKQVGFEPTDSYGDAPQTLVMSDGSLIIPSQDPEGNGPGFLFTTHGTGYVEPKREEQTCRM